MADTPDSPRAAISRASETLHWVEVRQVDGHGEAPLVIERQPDVDGESVVAIGVRGYTLGYVRLDELAVAGGLARDLPAPEHSVCPASSTEPPG